MIEAFHECLEEITEIREVYADTEEDFAKFRDYDHIKLEES